MTTAYTSLLGLALPVTGELSGTWGTTVNDSITSLLDSAVAGTTNISTDGDVTLTTTTGAANQAREAILLFSGARTALRTITAPAQSKVYTVINATTGGYSVKLVGVGPTTGVTIVAGESAVCAWNGSDFVKVSNTSGAGVFTSITNTGLTSGRVVYSTAGGLETDSANLTFNGTTLTANTLNLTNALGTTYGGTGLTSFTANGVVYASSSSALATGSALTFDGTTLGVSSGGSTPALKLYGAAVTQGQLQFSSTSGYAIQGGPDYTGLVYNVGSSSYQHIWQLAGSEQMRLTSTGLGIGTSSPAYKLDVAGNGIQITSGAGQKVRLIDNTVQMLNSTAVASGVLSFKRADGTQKSAIGSYYNVADEGDLEFIGPTGSTNMLLNSSGNLGLGVTPSAWGGATRAYDLAYYNTFSGGDDGSRAYMLLGSNFYESAAGTQRYKVTSGTVPASMYKQRDGVHSWYYAPNGTAGNAITFTQAMTLDASGRLGIGTTSPSTTLSVGSSASSGGNDLGIYLARGATTNFLETYDGTKTFIGGTDSSNAYVKVGSLSNHPVSIVQANGTAIYIDTSKNVLVGTTSNSTYSEKFNITTGSSTQVIMNLVATGTSSFGAVKFRNGSGEIGSISYLASAVIYNTTSDYRLKTVVGAVTGHGARIDALKPIDYQWKTSNEQARGFLAHEFKEVYPNSVTGEKDDVDADGNPVYQSMQASTSEVIADLVAEIQSLRKRLAALEAK